MSNRQSNKLWSTILYICGKLTKNYKVFTNNDNTQFFIKLLECESDDRSILMFSSIDSKMLKGWHYVFGYDTKIKFEYIHISPLFECTNAVKRDCCDGVNSLSDNQHDLTQTFIEIKRNPDGQEGVVLGLTKKTVSGVKSKRPSET